MIIYEITAEVASSFAPQFEEYMVQTHIPDVLATGHFISATIARDGDRYRIRYEAESAKALNNYLTRDSARLRADFSAHFPSGVALSRETWELIAALNP